MKKYQYDLTINDTSNGYNSLPMKLELILLKNILLRFEFKQFFKLIYYYFKRIHLLNEKTYDNIKLKKDLINQWIK